MNIFYLDKDPVVCARWHNDRHVNKMITETAMLLSNANYYWGSNIFQMCKEGWENHPCSKWARSSQSNYRWLAKLGLALCKEYTYRYEKIHKLQDLIEGLQKPPSHMPDKGFTEPPQCIAPEVKGPDTLRAYKLYYIFFKYHIAKWKKRGPPPWWTGIVYANPTTK